MLCLRRGENIELKKLLERLVEMQYQRNEIDFKRGTFRLRGDCLEIIPASEHKNGIRIEFLMKKLKE